MSLRLLADIWAAIAIAVGNHLWQSTLFAAVAALLTLPLRRNHAGVRYWLWMAASLKFLVPFSLLVTAGNYLSPVHAADHSISDIYVVMDNVSQPFSRVTAAPVAHASIMSAFMQVLPAILIVTWLAGFVAVIVAWLVRWKRVSSAIRAAISLHEGREVDVLRRLERAGGIQQGIRFLLSPSSLEPGIFGIARPVLIWPEGISARLEEAHLEAILAHEVCHVRRRDNLAAIFHMLVEAIFWFHPLVWWVGARMVEERERACDEQVLELGSHPQVYAESILKICEFCIGSPLTCVSGVTGADLKQRIVNIMNERINRKLDFARKVLLASAGLVAVIVPVVFGLMKPVQSRAQTPSQTTGIITPGFEHVSITAGAAIPAGNAKQSIGSRLIYQNDEITATNLTMADLIAAAYGVDRDEISGAPDWAGAELFDVNAKLDAATYEAFKKAAPSQGLAERQREFQTLLADRFRLVVHQESRVVAGYSLVVATNGPRLEPAKPGNTYADGIKGMPGMDPGPAAGPHRMLMGYGELIGQAISMSALARDLSGALSKPVVDNTGLTGDFDFKLRWTPTPGEFAGHKITAGGKVPDPSGPSLTTAIEQQLGLRLEPLSVPRQLVVVDRAEKPQTN